MEHHAGRMRNRVSTSLSIRQRTPRLAFLATIILVLAPFSSSAVAESEADSIDGDDLACLREFKESVTDPLGHLENWDFRGGNKVNICNFVGVTCLRPDEPKVHELDLAAAGLGGRFPRGLHKCSSLTGLNLSNNFFTGRIPPSICSNNRNLVTLDLSDNAFSRPFPPSLRKCLDSNIKWQQQHLHFDDNLHLGDELKDRNQEYGPLKMFSDL